MVFRLPTHLDSFIPPPSQQGPEQRPWRGALTVSGMRTSDKGSSQTIRVTAVETDGDKTDLWPSHLFAQITLGRPILRDVQGWVRRHSPPLCTFMPDRHRDPNVNVVNQSTFRSLSRILFEDQTVAISSWGSDDIPGAGVIIFPAQNSSSLLVGALFLTDPFPAFVLGTPSPTMPLSPGQMHPGYATHYQQPMSTPYATSSRHHHSISPQQQQIAYSTNPIDQSGSGHRQDQYRLGYTMPRDYSTTPTSTAEHQWPPVKDEEDGGYRFSTHDNTHYSQSG
ncbi:hypothetical protein BDZ94DRAFT_1271124 [Collybia nuda]|uniref:Uncharacterized protein n=1 Tax=Collybia nuda TaxID=64659 RepID=A0A9P5XV80_9AGAR|nr:hypothetical protein BDZ94DRAFT_1271124 [Collybia nuda]